MSVKIKSAVATLIVVGALLVHLSLAQPGRPPLRVHRVTQPHGKLKLVPTSQATRLESQASITVDRDIRTIRANGIPNHSTGPFPNRGNPHRVTPQRYNYRISASPKVAKRTTKLGMHNFGIAVNGVPFDPGAAEWYLGNPQGGWQYEPLSGAVSLGIDAAYAHVQPTGAYHYHGLPKQLLRSLKLSKSSHSPLVGWAADGFPIYAVYGFSDPTDANSGVNPIKTSYRLKRGRRPRGRGQPGGTYDGTFTADYEYVKGLGDLDECNGRFTFTPEFPDGSYVYFLTEAWPVVPRKYRGTPSQDFVRRGPPPGRGGRRPPPRPR